MQLTNGEKTETVRRRSPAMRIAALEERKRQIEAELSALSARERAAARKLDTRRKIVVGAAALAHAEVDPLFRRQLHRALESAVSRPVDRRIIADLLRTPQPGST